MEARALQMQLEHARRWVVWCGWPGAVLARGIGRLCTLLMHALLCTQSCEPLTHLLIVILSHSN